MVTYVALAGSSRWAPTVEANRSGSTLSVTSLRTVSWTMEIGKGFTVWGALVGASPFSLYVSRRLTCAGKFRNVATPYTRVSLPKVCTFRVVALQTTLPLALSTVQVRL